MELVELETNSLLDNLQVKYNSLLTEILSVLPGAKVTLKIHKLSLPASKEGTDAELITTLKERTQKGNSHIIIFKKRTRREVLKSLINILSTHISGHLGRRLLLVVKEPREIELIIRGLTSPHNESTIMNICFLGRERLKSLNITCPRCLSRMKFEGGELKTLRCKGCGLSSGKIRFSVEELGNVHVIMTSINDLIALFINKKALSNLNNIDVILTPVLNSEDVVVVKIVSLLSTYYRVFLKLKVDVFALITPSDKMSLSSCLRSAENSFLGDNLHQVLNDKTLVTIFVKTIHLTTPVFLRLVKRLANWSSKGLLVLVKDKTSLFLMRKIAPYENVKVATIDEVITLDHLNVDIIVTLGLNETAILSLFPELETLNDITTIVAVSSGAIECYDNVKQRMQTSLMSCNMITSLITLLMLYNTTSETSYDNECTLIDTVDRLTQIALSEHYLDLLALTMMDENRAKVELVKLIEALRETRLIAELLTNKETISSIKKIIDITNVQEILSLCLDRLKDIIKVLGKIDMDRVKDQLMSALSYIRSSFHVNVTDEEIASICKEFINNVYDALLNMKKLNKLTLKLLKSKEYELHNINELLADTLQYLKKILECIKLLNVKLTYEFDKRAHSSVVTEVVTTMRIYHMMKHKQLSNLIANLISAYNLMREINSHFRTMRDIANSINHEVYEKFKLVAEDYELSAELLITVASDVDSYQLPLTKALSLLAHILESDHIRELMIDEPQ